MARSFSIDFDRLAAFQARADAARGAALAAQERCNEARFQLGEAEREARRIEKARPGSPSGVIRIDESGRYHGRFESDHPRLVEQAHRRVEAARGELARLAREQSEGAARRAHDVEIWQKLERHARERGALR